MECNSSVIVIGNSSMLRKVYSSSKYCNLKKFKVMPSNVSPLGN